MIVRQTAPARGGPAYAPDRQIGLDQLTLGLLMAGAFCCPIRWTVLAGYLSLSDAFFLAALASHARSALRNIGELGGVPWPLLASGALFALSGMISYAIGEAHAEPLNAAKLIFSLTLFPLLLVLTVGTDLKRLDKVLMAWVAGGVLSAGVALASRYGISLLGYYDEFSAGGGRASGLTYHPNALGYTSALIAPVAAYLSVRFSHWGMRTLALGALAVLLSGVHLSGSRASVWALALGALYPVLRLLRGNRGMLLLTALLGAAALAALALAVSVEFDVQLPENFRESALGRALGLSTSAYGSNVERQSYIDFSWAAFQESPFFGAGYGWLRGAHVHLLAILHAGGLLGFSAFLLWILAVLSACWRVAGAQRKLGATFSGLWPVVVAGLVIWFVNGGLQPVLPDRNGYILIGVLFALDAHLRRTMVRHQRQQLGYPHFQHI